MFIQIVQLIQLTWQRLMDRIFPVKLPKEVGEQVDNFLADPSTGVRRVRPVRNNE